MVLLLVRVVGSVLSQLHRRGTQGFVPNQKQLPMRRMGGGIPSPLDLGQKVKRLLLRGSLQIRSSSLLVHIPNEGIRTKLVDHLHNAGKLVLSSSIEQGSLTVAVNVIDSTAPFLHEPFDDLGSAFPGRVEQGSLIVNVRQCRSTPKANQSTTAIEAPGLRCVEHYVLLHYPVGTVWIRSEVDNQCFKQFNTLGRHPTWIFTVTHQSLSDVEDQEHPAVWDHEVPQMSGIKLVNS